MSEGHDFFIPLVRGGGLDTFFRHVGGGGDTFLRKTKPFWAYAPKQFSIIALNNTETLTLLFVYLLLQFHYYIHLYYIWMIGRVMKFSLGLVEEGCNFFRLV